MKYLSFVVSAFFAGIMNDLRTWLRLLLLAALVGSLSLGCERASTERADDIHRRAEIAREDAAFLESKPVEQWCMANGAEDTAIPKLDKILLYVPEDHPVHQRGGKDPFGNPYVMGSVRQGVAVSAKTIELCAEVTKRDPTFWGHHDERVFGLIEAARKGDVEAVRTLVKTVPDPNIADKSGNKALLYAIGEHNEEMEKILTSHGAIVAQGDGSPLWWAIGKQNVKEMKALLDRFPSMATATETRAGGNGVPQTYQPAMYWASDYGDTNVVRMLLEYGADPNTADGYPLQNSVAMERMDMVKLLVEAGARITPAALSRSYGEMRKYLESQLNRGTNNVSSSGANTGAGP